MFTFISLDLRLKRQLKYTERAGMKLSAKSGRLTVTLPPFLLAFLLMLDLLSKYVCASLATSCSSLPFEIAFRNFKPRAEHTLGSYSGKTLHVEKIKNSTDMMATHVNYAIDQKSQSDDGHFDRTLVLGT